MCDATAAYPAADQTIIGTAAAGAAPATGCILELDTFIDGYEVIKTLLKSKKITFTHKQYMLCWSDPNFTNPFFIFQINWFFAKYYFLLKIFLFTNI